MRMIAEPRHLLSIFRSTPLKSEKIFMKCAQKESAHLQYVRNHYAKFE